MDNIQISIGKDKAIVMAKTGWGKTKTPVEK